MGCDDYYGVFVRAGRCDGHCFEHESSSSSINEFMEMRLARVKKIIHTSSFRLASKAHRFLVLLPAVNDNDT